MSDSPKHKRLIFKQTTLASLAWVIFIFSGEYPCTTGSVRSELTFPL